LYTRLWGSRPEDLTFLTDVTARRSALGGN
jgi:hypothetical protein